MKEPTKVIGFRVTLCEWKEFQEKAKRYGLTVPEYVRLLAREHLDGGFKEEVLSRQASLKAQVARIGEGLPKATVAILCEAGADPAVAEEWVKQNLS